MKTKETFINYLENRLSDAERLAFEEEMQKDPMLKAEFEEWQKVYNVINDNELLNFYQTLENQKETKRIPIYRRWRNIAAILVVALLSTVTYYVLQKPSHEDVYAQYFVDENAINTRSSHSMSNGEQALVFYDNKNYKKAKESLNTYLETEPGSHYHRYFLAKTYMQLQDFNAAEKELESIIKDDGYNPMKNPAKLQLALCYIHQDEIADAKTLLNELIELQDDSYECKKAQEILSKL